MFALTRRGDALSFDDFLNVWAELMVLGCWAMGHIYT
jgi:hypothetical protein